MALANLLDRFIPESIPPDSERHIRARIMCAILLFHVAFFPIGQLVIYFLRTVPQGYISRGHLLVTFITGCAAGALYLLHRFGVQQLIGNWFIASSYLSIVYPLMFMSDSPSILVQSLYIIPVVAATICGLSTAIIWALIVAASHIYFLQTIGGSHESTSFSMFIALMVYAVLLISFSIHIAIQRQDRAKLNQDRRMLDYEARHDELTQLTNRSGAQRALELWMESSELTHDVLGLLYIDLDKFKPINDRLGHASGDRVLQTVARRLNNSIRGADLACRVGGDEFAVLLQGLQNVEGASIAADKILQALREPIVLGEETVEIGASIGIALFPEHSESAEELWQLADKAMYEAKTQKIGIAAHAESSA